jgi:hypothetical protein
MRFLLHRHARKGRAHPLVLTAGVSLSLRSEGTPPKTNVEPGSFAYWLRTLPAESARWKKLGFLNGRKMSEVPEEAGREGSGA